MDKIFRMYRIRSEREDVSDGELHYYQYDARIFYVHQSPLGNYQVRFIDCQSCDQKCKTPDTPMVSLEENGEIINCIQCNTKWDSDFYSYISGSCTDGPPKQVITTEDDDYIYIDEVRNG